MILHVEKKQVNEDTITLSRVEYLNGIFEFLNGLMHPDLRLTSYYIYSRRDIQITELYTILWGMILQEKISQRI